MLDFPPISEYVRLGQDLQGLTTWREQVEDKLDQYFADGVNIRDVVTARSDQIDLALDFLWKNAGLDQTDLALFAVGGYGRREMLPYSDVDVLILSEDCLLYTSKLLYHRCGMWGTLNPELAFAPLKHAMTKQSSMSQLLHR